MIQYFFHIGESLKVFFYPCFLSVIIVAYSLLLIVFFQATFSLPSTWLLFFVFFCQVFRFCVIAVVPWSLRIWESVFYPQTFFALDSFSVVGVCTATICFSRLPWVWQFSLKVSRASCCSSKHSLGLTVCLNHTAVHELNIQLRALFKHDKFFY